MWGNENLNKKSIANIPIGKKSMLSALKVKHFQSDFAIFFDNGENATKFKETSKFRQEMLNILSV